MPTLYLWRQEDVQTSLIRGVTMLRTILEIATLVILLPCSVIILENENREKNKW